MGAEYYGSVTPLTCQAIRLGNRAFQLPHESTLQSPPRDRQNRLIYRANPLWIGFFIAEERHMCVL
jgi:hypothetical protein